MGSRIRDANAAKRGAGRAGPKRLARLRAKDARAAAEREANPDKAAEQKAARVLSGKAARYLRGLGHHLEPVVQIGKEGITDGVAAATRAALLAHELVKVKLSQDAPIDRKLAGDELADLTGSALAQTLGRTLLLYKRHPNKPKIVLPR
jgi:RNA-binding protein